MAQQTINVGAAPNDGTGTPLRTAFQYTNSNFTELYTALGGGSGLPGASGQLIFNNGTSLAGDNELFYNATTNTLTTEKLIVPGNTQVAGSASNLYVGSILNPTLFVNTNTNRVGIGTATPAYTAHVRTTSPILAIQDDTSAATGVGGTFNFLGYTSGTSGANVFAQIKGVKTAGSAGGEYQVFTSDSAGNSVQRYLIDATGISTWSVSGTTAMTLNSTGLGVGASPAAKLHVSNGATVDSGLFTGLMIGGATASARSASIIKDTSTPYNLIVSVQDFTGGTTGSFIVRNGSTDQFRIDSSGNVGVGVTPSTWWSGFKAYESSNAVALLAQTNVPFSHLVTNAYAGVPNWLYKVSGNYALRYAQDGTTGIHSWHNSAVGANANDPFTFTQAMTLDASGNLLVGTTSSSNTTQGFKILSTGRFYGVMATGGYAIMNHTGGSGTEYIYEFQRAGTAIGSITTTTTSTAYVTSSDYRLKETVRPLSGGLARVNAFKPSIYKWKADGSAGEGFIAHELAEVVPAAVTGEKDAVNEDGSIKPQGVDLSKVVPILVAAIKELTARVQTLEAK